MRWLVAIVLLGCNSSSPSGGGIDAPLRDAPTRCGATDAGSCEGIDAPRFLDADTAPQCGATDAGTGCSTGQFCVTYSAGVAPAPFQGCTAYPAACSTTQTCDCLMAQTVCGGESMLCGGSGDQLHVICMGI